MRSDLDISCQGISSFSSLASRHACLDDLTCHLINSRDADLLVVAPATADLIHGQTDEDDLGVSYPEADLILHHLLSGRSPEWLAEAGFERAKVDIVFRRLEGTHWKRNLPTVAMLSGTTIGEWYLRPVDY